MSFTESEWVSLALKDQGRTDLPSHVCKFLSADDPLFVRKLRDLIVLSRLYLSGRKHFNDPFDCSVEFTQCSKDEQEQLIKQLAIGLREAGHDTERLNVLNDTEAVRTFWKQTTDSIIDQVGIYCLSAELYNPLMWAHYSSKHTGVALLFENRPGAWKLRPVRYVQNQATMTIPIGASGGQYDHMLMQKMADWKYEDEWRVMAGGKVGEYVVFPHEILIGIVFGLNAERSTYDLIFEMLLEREARGWGDLSLFVLERGEYSLITKQVVSDNWELAACHFDSLDGSKRKNAQDH